MKSKIQISTVTLLAVFCSLSCFAGDKKRLNDSFPTQGGDLSLVEGIVVPTAEAAVVGGGVHLLGTIGDSKYRMLDNAEKFAWSGGSSGYRARLAGRQVNSLEREIGNITSDITLEKFGSYDVPMKGGLVATVFKVGGPNPAAAVKLNADLQGLQKKLESANQELAAAKAEFEVAKKTFSREGVRRSLAKFRALTAVTAALTAVVTVDLGLRVGALLTGSHPGASPLLDLAEYSYSQVEDLMPTKGAEQSNPSANAPMNTAQPSGVKAE